MSNHNVTIVELNSENWYDCCQLDISVEQKAFIESNAVSIAQSKFQPTLKPYAIYDNDQVVGFLMFNSEKEELDGYWIYRIMIDQKYQNKGLGKIASQQMFEEMKNLLNANKIIVGYHPENLGAHQLYKSLGFVDEGHRFGKEMAVIKYI
ncbi:GNAT family N-acetyltransferase [Bacillus carboniphilus]|uniref:GNAT family N-acetyltransferase n=1 Tax=Bacillus carboniphilus TaxID=86663 RepID=A0ABY9JRW8_9BACI|nr:GNAT family N-acetyltransferase [Bacillus carboniphilus]WLR41483.1 GNAT family N-acetyltransferase [Bacillus carboniphilus]